MNPDWNFEPADEECDECGYFVIECICEDPYQADTLKEFYGEE